MSPNHASSLGKVGNGIVKVSVNSVGNALCRLSAAGGRRGDESGAELVGVALEVLETALDSAAETVGVKLALLGLEGRQGGLDVGLQGVGDVANDVVSVSLASRASILGIRGGGADIPGQLVLGIDNWDGCGETATVVVVHSGRDGRGVIVDGAEVLLDSLHVALDDDRAGGGNGKEEEVFD